MTHPPIPPTPPAKVTDKRGLMAMQVGVFDAVMSLACAMDKGLLNAFLVAPSTKGAMCELILPCKAGAPDTDPNPSRQIEAATPAAVVAMAGEIVHQMIMVAYQNGADFQDYVDMRAEASVLRKSTILIPGGN